MKTIIAALILSPPVLAQMNFQSTIYQEFDQNGSTLHISAYTSDPGCCGFTHTYSNTIQLVLPGGHGTSAAGYGQDYTPATSDVWLDVQESDIDYVDNFEDGSGYIYGSVTHSATCSDIGPFLYAALTPFDIPGISLKTTTTKTYAQDWFWPQNVCHTEWSCWNTTMPACGTQDPFEIWTFAATCSDYYKNGFIATPVLPGQWRCSVALSIGFNSYPGYQGWCTPALP
jgi:hypothetical protein